MTIIEINEEANGSQVQVEQNDIIEITLAEVPTSGYRWVFEQLDVDHFNVLSDDYGQHTGAGMGGGGNKKISLQVIAKGAGVIRLHNKQKWSGDIDKTFELWYC